MPFLSELRAAPDLPWEFTPYMQQQAPEQRDAIKAKIKRMNANLTHEQREAQEDELRSLTSEERVAKQEKLERGAAEGLEMKNEQEQVINECERVLHSLKVMEAPAPPEEPVGEAHASTTSKLGACGACGAKNAIVRCSRCKSVFYCNVRRVWTGDRP